jgi:hypothetical protein
MSRPHLPFTILVPVDCPCREDKVTLLNPKSYEEMSFIWEDFSEVDVALACDIETKGNKAHDLNCVVTQISFADSRGSWSIDFRLSYPECYSDMLEALHHYQTPLCFHNGYYDMGFLYRDLNQVIPGVGLREETETLGNASVPNLFSTADGRWLNFAFDTYSLYKHLASESWIGQRWGLKEAQVDLLGWEDRGDVEMMDWLEANGFGKGKAAKSEMHNVPSHISGRYNALDSESTWQILTKVLYPAAQRFEAVLPYQDYFLNLVRMLIIQQLSGIRIDKEKLELYQKDLSERIRAEKQKFLTHEDVAPHVEFYEAQIKDAHAASEPEKFKQVKIPDEPEKLTKKGEYSKAHAKWVLKWKHYKPEVSYRWECWNRRGEELAKADLFNMNSADDRRWLFYTRLENQVLLYTDSETNPQPSTDSDAMRFWGEPGKILIHYSELVKELSYVDKCLEVIQEDSPGNWRLHPQFRCPGTATWRLSGSGGLNCFPTTTEILTSNGWKSYDTFSMEADEVVQIDPVTRHASTVPASNLILKWYEGNLLNFQERRGGLAVTPEHRMAWYGAKIQNHKYLGTHPASDLFPQTRLEMLNCALTSNIGVIYSDEEIWKAAAIQADGHQRPDRKNVYAIGVKKERKRDRLLELFGEYSNVYSGVYTWCYIKFTSSLLDPETKTLDLKNLSSECASTLLSAISFWDGTHKSRTNGINIEYSSKVEKNIDELQAYFVRSGYSTAKRCYKGQYRLYITDNLYSTVDKKKHITTIPYSGHVWCVSVPTGHIIVRSNGRVFVTGNCQQQPKTRGYLECFIPDSVTSWIDSDFSSLEPHVLAEASRDPTYMSLYGPKAKSHTDVYLHTGCKIPRFEGEFRAAGYCPEEPTKEGTAQAKKECKGSRNIVKCLVLAASYGAGAAKIRQSLALSGVELSFNEVKQIHTDYWRAYAGVKQYGKFLEDVWDRSGGYTLNPIGHPVGVAEMYKRDLTNRNIQSSGHQCLVIQIGILADLLAERGIPWLPIIIDFHDESLIQVPQGREAETIECFNESFVKLNEFLNGVVKLKGNPMTVETLADAKCED